MPASGTNAGASLSNPFAGVSGKTDKQGNRYQLTSLYCSRAYVAKLVAE